MPPETPAPTWKTLLAFAIVYLVWGSAYFAIRVGVHDFPPFLMAAIRFLIAGIAVYGWRIARGDRSPTPRQWLSTLLLGFLIFILNFGMVFWASQRVPSGVTGVMMALMTVFVALTEIFVLRTQRLSLRLALALLAGIAGVAVLMSPSLHLGGAPIDRAGALALISASLGMAIASAIMRRLPLPESKLMSSGAQMLTGGLMLALLSALMGELHGFDPRAVSFKAWMALAYLVVAASIVTFTAYVWLIHHQSPTKAGTYAYVNPVVAVLIGYFLGGETLERRTIAGSLLILLSVVAITTMRMNQPTAELLEEEPI
jgi:drug/metabolite transporter (DMT)-like permease